MKETDLLHLLTAIFGGQASCKRNSHLDYPVRHHLLGDVDIIPQEFLTDSI